MLFISSVGYNLEKKIIDHINNDKTDVIFTSKL